MQSKYNFPRYTYNDYKNWKEDWELIDGYPLQLLHYSDIKHNRLKTKLIGQTFDSFELKSSNKCEVYTELDWKINEETVVRPDLMIICGEAEGNYLEFPPVLIIEILSPSSINKDRVIKFDLYREQGVKYYIMIDFTKKTTEVFELIDNFYKQVQINEFLISQDCTVIYDFEKLWK